MPYYDYVCDNCGHGMEMFQSIKDKPKKKCPECGKYQLRRIIHPPQGIHFRGTGFYSTDYKNK